MVSLTQALSNKAIQTYVSIDAGTGASIDLSIDYFLSQLSIISIFPILFNAIINNVATVLLYLCYMASVLRVSSSLYFIAQHPYINGPFIINMIIVNLTVSMTEDFIKFI